MLEITVNIIKTIKKIMLDKDNSLVKMLRVKNIMLHILAYFNPSIYPFFDVFLPSRNPPIIIAIIGII